MRRILWSIPGITVYLYATSVLIQYGFNAYFGIPADFINASITTNIINYFGLFQLAKGIAGVMGWWMWFILIISILIIGFLCIVDSRNQKFFTGIGRFIGTCLLLYFLYISFSFGMLLAKNTADFLVPSPTCLSIANETQYIVPGFYNEKAILVPINPKTHKMTGGFILRDLSQLPCKLKSEPVGPIGR